MKKLGKVIGLFLFGVVLAMGTKENIEATEQAGVVSVYATEEETDKVAIVSSTQSGTKLYGYMDAMGKEIIPCQYGKVYDYANGKAVVDGKDGQMYVVNSSGNQLIGLFEWKQGQRHIQSRPGGMKIFRYVDYKTCLKENCMAVKENGKWTFMDFNGNTICGGFYDIYRVKDGVAKVKQEKNGNYGLVDLSTGKMLVECIFSEIDEFVDGFAQVKFEGKYGIINREGKLVVPCKYDEIGRFSENMVVVHRDNRYGFVNNKGEEVIKCQYVDAGDFSEGLAMVSKTFSGKTGFINKKGKVVVKLKYESASKFSGGYAVVENVGGEYGYVDKKGKEFIKCKYARATSFSEGLALVMDAKDRYQYINKKGKIVISAGKYKSASLFTNGLAIVQDYTGKWSYIDKKGKKVVKLKSKYDDVYAVKDGRAVAMNSKGKWCYLNKKGKELFAPMYNWEDTDFLPNENAIVCGSNHKYGMIDKNGKILAEFKYDSIDGFECK